MISKFGGGAPANGSPGGTDPPEAGAAAGTERRNRRILAVVNPVAGPRGSQGVSRDLKERAAKSGVHLDMIETRADQSAADAVAAIEGEYDCYLALGGDGTVMDVAEAAMRSGVPMAILPRGTANAVAWHFGLPFDAARAWKVAVEGRPITIDVGRTPNRKFLIMAGLGYDAHVIEGATRILKRRFGFLAYLYASLTNLSRRPYTFRVYLDEREPVRLRGAAAVITNIGTLAGNIRLVKEVSPLDGLLDLVVIAPANFRDFFRMVLRGIVGRLQEDPRVRFYRASRIKVDCRPAAPLEVDGEEAGGRHRDLQAEVLPAALTLMIPPEGMLKVPWMPEVPWSPTRSLRRSPAVSPDL